MFFWTKKYLSFIAMSAETSLSNTICIVVATKNNNKNKIGDKNQMFLK